MNAPPSMYVTKLGMLIVVRFEQPRNDSLPIVVTVSGTLTDVMPLQFIKALFPIPATVYFVPSVSGYVTVSRIVSAPVGAVEPFSTETLLVPSITVYFKPPTSKDSAQACVASIAANRRDNSFLISMRLRVFESDYCNKYISFKIQSAVCQEK